ncbi:MAG: hypothetical protein OXD29_15925 [Roseovarius sp.]|nr:hypothetical protein [Roseovarius sp.]
MATAEQKQASQAERPNSNGTVIGGSGNSRPKSEIALTVGDPGENCGKGTADNQNKSMPVDFRDQITILQYDFPSAPEHFTK